jgi:WD40 repeat protein
MTGKFKYDVFLSHNAKDKDRVRSLAERLRHAGLQVWFDEWVIKPGDDIYLAIERGLEVTRTLILCMSPNAFGSNWVSLERSTVLFRDPTNEGRCFIPLLLTDCDLPDALRRYKYVDFREEAEAAFGKLLTACQPEVGQTLLRTKLVPEKKPLGKSLVATFTGESEPQEKPQPKKTPKNRIAPSPKPLSEKKQETKLKPKLKPKLKSDQAEPLAELERKLTGHTNWVNSVAVSPDGKWAASGSWDNTVKIWDLDTGECRATLEGHTGEVPSVAITPDGKRVISGSNDKSVRIWDPLPGRELAKLDGHTDWVRSVLVLQDNARVLSGGDDNILRLWDIAPASCIKIIECRKDGSDKIFSSATNSAGTHALSGHRAGRIRYWNIETGECLAALKGHLNDVNSVQITPDGRFAVSGSDDKTVKIWDLEAQVCIGTLEGHQDKVHSVAISPDGAMIASTGFTDKTVRLWDWKSGVCLQVIKQEEEYFEYFAPISVAFSPDVSRLVVGTTDGTIYVCRLTTARPAPSAEATRRYVNAKVVLLGEGTVGKTSLAHRLIEDKYVIRDRTHGMNVWRLDLPPNINRTIDRTADAMLDREALLWDLAGQEDYRLIHQLFLEETALALLLLNPQNTDPFAEAGDWLKALKTAAENHESKREPVRLLIFSQLDVGSMKLGKAKIERFIDQHGFSGCLPTSAKTGLNCSDNENEGQPSKLKQLIAESIPWDKLPWTSTPRLLAELKKAVMAMRDDQDIRLLRFAELVQRLKQSLPEEKFDESEVRTAVTLLANHGLAHPLKFGDLILLQPELINGYAGAIIRAARVHIDEIGCVSEADIYQPDFDFTGVERLNHRPDEELLLRALVQTFLDHSLCIAEDTSEGRHLVFPSQYRREKDIPYEPDIFVSYTFSGEWQTVWTTLVVRLWYSNEFEHRELWRNAAEFESAKGRVLGLKIDNQQGEGTGIISLYFDKDLPDELKVIFIEYVHRHLAKYGCDVRRDRRYVCLNCGKPVNDLDTVQKRLETGKDFIYCQLCDEKVPLIDFIEQHLKTDPVARKILAMEETATRELDTQALEQILIGHMMAIAGEANQIFRPVSIADYGADYGIDGELEFRDNDGKPSGSKIYVQLKSGNSYLRTRKTDSKEVFDVKNERHLEYWLKQPVDVYLVIRQTDETSKEPTIRWMNISRYLKQRENKDSRQIIFEGEKLDMKAVWEVRDEFFPPQSIS